MKIALVILHADPMRGGAERYTVDLAAALVKRGQEVALLATSFSDEVPQPQRVVLAADGLTRTRRYHRMLDSLESHLDRTHYDAIHAMLPVRGCHLYHPHAGLAAMAATTGMTTWLNPRRVAMAKVERRLLQSSHPPRVLCLSDYLRRQVRQHYPLDEAHLPILFNAVDTAKFSPESKPKPPREQTIALMIAQDFERKGLHEAIVALSKVKSPLILRVVGKQDPAKYRKLAEQLGIADRVQFAGPVHDPAGEYRNADFFVLPTKHDPCSLVVLEALATGLPVISTRLNGACEIMTNDVHGFVISDPANTDALAQAMQKMLDPQLRAKMSLASLELRPRLAYDNHLDQLMRIYEQCAVQSPRTH